MPLARRSARTASSAAGKTIASPYSRADLHTSPTASRPSASIARQPNGKTSLRLTVKAPPSKLRQATSGSALHPNLYTDQSESDSAPALPRRAARTTRNPRTVVEPDSDEDDEDEDAPGEEEGIEEDEQAEDEDAEGEVDHSMLANEDSEDDAEGEDEEMEDYHPSPPVVKQDRAHGRAKGNMVAAVPSGGPLKSVEKKGMYGDDDDDDDEELSELESGEPDGDEGEEEDEDEEEEEEDEEEEGGEEGEGEQSEGDGDDENSRSATPDLSKLTRRQRGVSENQSAACLLALSNEAQKKKHLTAEEHAMRRAEMARRRKNLSDKRNEEVKMDTINKLLKKPAPKRRTRAEIEAAKTTDMTPGADDGEGEKVDPIFVRWVNNRHGSRSGMSHEWLEAPCGEMFRKAGNGGVVEEMV